MCLRDSIEKHIAIHKAFADTPEEEVARDLEEALAEVRRKRV